MQCSACGNTIPPSVWFCAYCGAKTVLVAASNSPSFGPARPVSTTVPSIAATGVRASGVSASRKSFGLLFGIGATLIILIVGAIAIAMSGPDKDTAQVLTQDSTMSPPDQSIESRPLNNEENVGPQDIYLTNADGSDLVNLTQTPGADESSPVWSPNGREIAYLSSGSLWIISIDGADARKIADASGATPISWSPNSETIAFVDSDRLNVVDRDGGNLRELVFVIDLLVSASPWSPDSKRLTFSGRPAIILFPKETNLFEEEWERGEPGENIYAINIDGSGFVRLLSPSDVWVTLPSWSPDGKSITFNTYYALPGLIPPSGGNLVLLGNRGANSKDLTGTYPGRTLLWSSDSKSVVSEGDDGSIYEIDVSTDRVTSVLSRKLSPFTDAGKSIALSPTGDKIAFVSDRMIYVIDKNSGAQTALAEGASPAWSPDGKKIAFVHGVTFITLGMNKSFRNIEEDVGIRDGLKADYRDSVIRFR